MNKIFTPIHKSLKRINHIRLTMKRGSRTCSKLKGDKLFKAIKKAQKDPQFMKDVNKFIKATTN